MLVSLHFPKTAGTSFRRLLETHFGDALLPDYSDRPLNRGRWQRRSMALRGCLRHALPQRELREIACIHGHFLPLKYRLMALRTPVQYVAWLRDPVERLASHFLYWQRSYNPRDAGQLHRRVVEERWDLERFCLGPELQNTYSKFLWGFPLARFDFVGITEHYADDAAYFSRRFLGCLVDEFAAENVNDEQPAGDMNSYITDPDFRTAVARHHARDQALYRQALAMRAARDE